jgi:hypothetical protein
MLTPEPEPEPEPLSARESSEQFIEVQRWAPIASGSGLSEHSTTSGILTPPSTPGTQTPFIRSPSPSPASTRPRQPLAQARPNEEPAVVHTFERHGRARSTYEINIQVKRKLLEDLTEHERSRDGYIYAYAFPAAHSIRSSANLDPLALHFKIGRSMNVTRRLDFWSAQCKYSPQLEYQSASIPAFARFEKIIHILLGNERRREVDCPGCGNNHIEWFELDSDRATDVIETWEALAEQEIYDARGRLKENWRTRLGEVDLHDDDCWYDFIHEDS